MLTKKTTILFPPGLHRRLTRLAEQKRTSLGDLVRSACEHEHGAVPAPEKVAAVRRMAALALPVSSPRRVKQLSVVDARSLAP